MYCIHDGKPMQEFGSFHDPDAKAHVCQACGRIQVHTRDLTGRPHILLYSSTLELAGQFPNQFQLDLFQPSQLGRLEP